MAKSLRGYVGSIIKTAREFDETYLKRIILVMLSMTEDELIKATKNPRATCLELAIGAMILRAVKDSDMSRLGFLLDRSLGRVAQNVNLDLNPSVQYITEINTDGNLIRSVVYEEPEVIDVKAIEGGKDGKTQSKGNSKS